MQMRFPLSGKIFPWKKNSAAGRFLFFPGSKNRAVGWLDVHVRLSQEGFFGTFWSAAGERRGKAPIVVKVDKHGNRYHEPPYTQAEEDEFYRRVGRGPITVARPAGDRKEQTSPAPQQPSPAKPERAGS
jgi:hypothetical protein